MRPLRSHPTPRAGAAPLGVLLWLFGLLLFVAPFLRERAAPEWNAPDTGRKLAPFDAQDQGPLDLAFAEEVAAFDREAAAHPEWGIEGSLAALIAETSARDFGPDSAYLRRTGMVHLERLEAGEEAYRRHCAGCHGLDGDGGGPAARHLAPRPRNFRRGVFKFKSTDASGRPVRKDLFRTITAGLVGSSMPGFRLFSEERRWDLVEYVRYVAIRGEYEQLMLALAQDDQELPDPDEVREIVEERWTGAGQRPVYPGGPETEADEASIARGRELFGEQGASCHKCHGMTGEGDGPSAGAFQDAWGYPIQPRDFTDGRYRVGTDSKDLYMVIANGIAGTPMPSLPSTFSSGDAWDLVHYVESLAVGRSEGGE